ncbi:MAG: nucleoside monophosphate kinase [Terriglobales bacterium]
MSAQNNPLKESLAQSNNGRAGWFQASSADCTDVRQANGSPWRLVLLGAPGVGKGTQADLLNQRLSACHLSTGDLFRAASKQRECDQSPAIKAAMEHMRRGELVPDSTVWEMVRERADCIRCSTGFVLDGFPRTLGQAESLKQLMESEKIPLNAVVNYELPLAEIVARLSGRGTCEKCKSVYHVTGQPPKVEGVCDRCGGRLFQREDDRPESITVRMAAYERSTAPLIEFYQSLGLLVSITATGSPEEICTRTVAALEARMPALSH